jgi:AraC-like DNA-binding protein
VTHPVKHRLEAEDLAAGLGLGEDRIGGGGALGAGASAIFRMSETSTSGQRHTVPIGLVSQLTQLVKRWDVRPSDLMAAVGLEERILEDPFLRIPVPTMCALLDRARTMTGEPGLGYFLGLHTRATLYGYVGFAALAASTVGDAINLGLQFAPIFSTALAADLRVEGRIASITLEERADLGSVRDIVLISMIIGLRELGRAGTGRDTGGSADFTFPEPAYCARFAHLALNSRFNQPINRIRFDVDVLNYPVVTGDPVAREIARLQCERELAELGMRSRLADRVRRLLADEEASLEQIASRLELSPRTMRRRLAAEGVSFSTLVDQTRRDEALRLLRSSRLSVEEVARQLGYTTASTFVRAFHRWTGQTPMQYRRAAGLP